MSFDIVLAGLFMGLSLFIAMSCVSYVIHWYDDKTIKSLESHINLLVCYNKYCQNRLDSLKSKNDLLRKKLYSH